MSLGTFKEVFSNTSYTENGAITYNSTNNAILDFFFKAPGYRLNPSTELYNLFDESYNIDPQTTLRLLFYIRDVRGGQGERDVFRRIITHYCNTSLGGYWIFKNIKLIAEYGRWDDLVFIAYNTTNYVAKDNIINFLKLQLLTDYRNAQLITTNNPISLLAKWMPSENASSKTTKKYAEFLRSNLKWTPKEYRQILSTIRKKLNLIETNIVNKNYTFNYESIPSKAHLKYVKAFIRNDGIRYSAYQKRVSEGKSKINVNTLYPYDIIRQAYDALWNNQSSEPYDNMWNNLPDYVPDIQGIVVADTSGSMIGLPMAISISLAMYIAERNKCEAFKNLFISFSYEPAFHIIKGKTLFEKMKSVELGDIANTNLQKVFDLILFRAIANTIPNEEMPKILFIISDMEFDVACKYNYSNNFETIKNKYSQFNYTMPKLVFWNVNTRSKSVDVTIRNENVLLLSGCSPIALKYALTGGNDLMGPIYEIVNSPRYKDITI